MPPPPRGVRVLSRRTSIFMITGLLLASVACGVVALLAARGLVAKRNERLPPAPVPARR